MQAKKMAEEISSMLLTAFTQLNTEYGLSLTVPPLPDLDKYLHSLTDIEQSHVHYLGFGHTFKLTQPEFCERLGRALASRLRVVYESVANDLEVWNKAAAGQLDAQLRDRRRNYSRRVEAVVRIQEAAGELDVRMRELAQQVDGMDRQAYQLEKMTVAMLELNRDHVTQPLPLMA